MQRRCRTRRSWIERADTDSHPVAMLTPTQSASEGSSWHDPRSRFGLVFVIVRGPVSSRRIPCSDYALSANRLENTTMCRFGIKIGDHGGLLVVVLDVELSRQVVVAAATRFRLAVPGRSGGGCRPRRVCSSLPPMPRACVSGHGDPIEVPGAIGHRRGGVVGEAEDLLHFPRRSSRWWPWPLIRGVIVGEHLVEGLDFVRLEHACLRGQLHERRGV